MREEIAKRIGDVRQRIARAADRAGRDANDIRLIGAAKTMPAEVVRAAIDAGLTDVGQNYVKESLEILSELESVGFSTPVRWHLIGHLQRNKAGRAARAFDVVQTVDSLALGRGLARHAAEQGKVLSVLVEVNLAGESTKNGVDPAGIGVLLEGLRQEASLRVDGLMAIPPVSSEAVARGYFRTMRELRDEHGLRELSMGMTNDFEAAIEEGSTMVRVGRAIFGERGG